MMARKVLEPSVYFFISALVLHIQSLKDIYKNNIFKQEPFYDTCQNMLCIILFE